MNSEEGSAQFTQGFLCCYEVFTFNNGKLGESFKDLAGDFKRTLCGLDC